VRGGQGAERQLTSSKEPERMGICHHEKGTVFPSKGVFSFVSLSNRSSFFSCCVCIIKKDFLCRLKINHVTGSK
jgi:hypothetical protein